MAIAADADLGGATEALALSRAARTERVWLPVTIQRSENKAEACFSERPSRKIAR
jgi:hypothetical protein